LKDFKFNLNILTNFNIFEANLCVYYTVESHLYVTHFNSDFFLPERTFSWVSTSCIRNCIYLFIFLFS